MTSELSHLVQFYSNTPKIHKSIWESFYAGTNRTEYLKRHRDYIEQNDYGYGDRPFHYMWKILVDNLPRKFTFLEIGVFKGQTISLIQLLSDKLHKQAEIYGVTPLNSIGDKYSSHPAIDYLQAIKLIYRDFHLSFSHTHIIKGYSQETQVVQQLSHKQPFDMVYIDGSHTYEIVLRDIQNYAPLIKKGGFLIIDDASLNLRLPKYVYPHTRLMHILLRKNKTYLFPGIPDVAQAIQVALDSNKHFTHLFACGHDRVWQKV